jgi:hypothetical protein
MADTGKARMLSLHESLCVWNSGPASLVRGKRNEAMATRKSPAQLLAELRARRMISQQYLDRNNLEQDPERQDWLDRNRPPAVVEGTFLHRGSEELAEDIIRQQHEEQEAAERDRVLQDVTITEVVDELR